MFGLDDGGGFLEPGGYAREHYNVSGEQIHGLVQSAPLDNVRRRLFRFSIKDIDA